MPNPILHELLAWLRDLAELTTIRSDTMPAEARATTTFLRWQAKRWADALAEVLLVQDAHQHVADLCAGVENDAFTEVANLRDLLAEHTTEPPSAEASLPEPLRLMLNGWREFGVRDDDGCEAALLDLARERARLAALVERLMTDPPAQMTYAGGLVPINSDGMRKVIDDASRLAAEVTELRARHNPEVCVDTMELNERLWRERDEARAEAAAARELADMLDQDRHRVASEAFGWGRSYGQKPKHTSPPIAEILRRITDRVDALAARRDDRIDLVRRVLEWVAREAQLQGGMKPSDVRGTSPERVLREIGGE